MSKACHVENIIYKKFSWLVFYIKIKKVVSILLSLNSLNIIIHDQSTNFFSWGKRA